MKALVIGSNGYLGRHLVQHLIQNGIEVQAADIAPESKDAIRSYLQLDATNYEKVAALALQEYQVIYFFAGLTGTSAGFAKYEDFVRTNELTLLHLLKAHTESKSKARIIFPSTRLVYKGQENLPLLEDAEKEFKTVYAINKYACEQYLEMWNRSFGTPYTILRLCVPYGNLLDNAYSYGTLGFFLNKAAAAEPITLFGDGNLKRTFSHVADICTYFRFMGMDSKQANGIFNIPGEHFSLKEIAENIAVYFNSKVEYVPFPPADLLIESGDTLFNGEKLIDYIGYSPIHTMDSWLSTLKQ